ncbi:hypothetical protein CYLTODRAFT_380235 [Cylindrobasidium torrendii FP15055 ss-10]|uniref:Man1/Src1 C-terminal domain-containing protein n=1 Tax=Cylindrobasidium torrendii FP15055 ss-10 TaxID=1314674 RepID=A0A0D7B380_9AGAR|nr:hypothetical protein CYLTODRAFT_380235 [Cylindrobasidium torrendii FP15055 ss-10]
MSRLTATQVIANGNYLEPDFEPTSLTVSQLLGVLHHHGISYPTPYTKPKLVATFNDKIKANLVHLQRQRLKAESSIASDDGITDGMTGQPISSQRQHADTTTTRRTSRRLSRAPPDEISEPLKVDPPKRRRSSVQPRVGGASAVRPEPQPTVAEESEPEEDELPARKVSRGGKKKTAGQSIRRRSQNEDSGWEDNNIFQSGQSGGETSSPGRRKSKSRTRRSTTRKSRASSSLPSESSPMSSPTRPSGSQGMFSSSFAPRLPQLPSPRSRNFLVPTRFDDDDDEPVPVVQQPSPSPSPAPAPIRHRSPMSPEPKHEEQDSYDEYPPDDQNHYEDHGSAYAGSADGGEEQPLVVSPDHKGVAELSDDEEFAITEAPEGRAMLGSWTKAGLWGSLAAMGVACAGVYKQEAMSVGYCDTGSNTNAILESYREERLAMRKCSEEHNSSEWVEWAASIGNVTCPGTQARALPVPLLPDSCTPCPPHAECRQPDHIECEVGYVLEYPFPLNWAPLTLEPSNATFKPNDFGTSVWSVKRFLFDGAPLLEPVAFAPKCIRDPSRLKKLSTLGKWVEGLLKEHRGAVLCDDPNKEFVTVSNTDGGEAKFWGLPYDDELKAKVTSRFPRLQGAELEYLYSNAVMDLQNDGTIIISSDSSGKAYIAHTVPELSMKCEAKVTAYRLGRAYWQSVLGSSLFGTFLTWMYYRSLGRRQLKQRAREIAPAALRQVRNAELAYHTDPVTTPSASISSLQLRDYLLHDMSLSQRTALWNEVAKLVEQNTNVRANLEESDNGDEMRVWRWVGGGIGVGKLEASPEPEEEREGESGQE